MLMSTATAIIMKKAIMKKIIMKKIIMKKIITKKVITKKAIMKKIITKKPITDITMTIIMTTTMTMKTEAGIWRNTASAHLSITAGGHLSMKNWLSFAHTGRIQL